MTHAARQRLIAQVEAGDLTPDEAEREAARLGVGPLAGEPPSMNFAPMEEEFWSLPMAAAWIAYRTPAAVREWWEAFRAECREWKHQPLRFGPDGLEPEGYSLERRPPPTLSRFEAAAAGEDRGQRFPAPAMTAREATHALYIALRTDCFTATGIAMDSERRAIPARLWRHSGLFGDDTLITSAEIGEEEAFSHITVQRGAITMLWPAAEERPTLTLPPLMAPDGPGFMPLYCAAQWIATRGGAEDFDPLDTDTWRPAYAALLDAISSGDVHLTGMARGARETVDGVVFAGCQVSYPFVSTPPALLFSDDFYLCSYAYMDEESWRRGHDDAFENGREKRWTQLMVRKVDVARLWPFAPPAPPPDADAIRTGYRSGAPGKPSSMHLVEAEFAARIERGEVAETLAREAETLAKWREREHPQSPGLTAKTIENRIRDRFNALRRPR